MSAHRVTMRKTREILRLRWGQELAQNVVAQSCNCSGATVHRVVTRAQCAGLSWPLPAELDEEALEAKLYPKIAQPETYPEPDCKHIHFELGRKGVTLVLLWQVYRDQHPNGCGYSTFCSRYRAFRKALDMTMRLHHEPGEKMQVDYAGDRMPVYDPRTGEAKQVSIFVAAMGASQYIYTRAVAGEDSFSWLQAHEGGI